MQSRNFIDRYARSKNQSMRLEWIHRSTVESTRGNIASAYLHCNRASNSTWLKRWIGQIKFQSF